MQNPAFCMPRIGKIENGTQNRQRLCAEFPKFLCSIPLTLLQCYLDCSTSAYVTSNHVHIHEVALWDYFILIEACLFSGLFSSDL